MVHQRASHLIWRPVPAEYGPQDSAGFLMSFLGAIVLLWIYRTLVRRRTV